MNFVERGKQKALFLVLERGREAKTVVCISRPWGAYVRQQPFCPRPLKERRHPLPKPI